MKKAMLWKALNNSKVQCNLCNHFCVIDPGSRGRCNVRKNEDGVLYSLNYSHVVATNIDPIEKKPLFHFFPGSKAFSVAAIGCNFTCMFCQNCTISQATKDSSLVATTSLSPQEVVEKAVMTGCESIAHTYTEPTVYFEYVYETARIAKKKGLKTVLVSNGFLSDEAVEMLVPLIDGINIDLKAWSDETYKSLIGGRVEPVKRNIKNFHEAGVLVEVTTLVVPDMNSSSEELSSIAEWIYSVDPLIPWHVSRFYPAFHMSDRQPTSVGVMNEAYRLGKEAGLAYVYVGNLPHTAGESTFCHSCNSMLVERKGYSIVENRLIRSADDAFVLVCPDCGSPQNFAGS